jgi:hypothetical protein
MSKEHPSPSSSSSKTPKGHQNWRDMIATRYDIVDTTPPAEEFQLSWVPVMGNPFPSGDAHQPQMVVDELDPTWAPGSGNPYL